VDIRELPLDELVLDPNLNLRDRLDDFTVERYAEAWQRMPPVTVFDVDGQLLLADGFHRHAAAVLLGRRTIPAEIRTGSFTDALDFVAGVNLFHGLPLTRSERRRAVDIKLRLHHDWSDRRLAEELGVSRELVAKTRRNLIEAGQVPNNPGRVGADGKIYSSAGLPKEPHERPKKAAEEPRGKAPWDDTKTPLPTVAHEPAVTGKPGYKAAALAEPVPSAAPTIDEMLAMMARQIMEMITWTQAEGFVDAYHGASGNAKGLFQAAVIKLAARADQLRKL
jgi:ParB-like chromosome segregation protein Spo0J